MNSESNAADGDSGPSLPNLVSNFQDLSAVLSLFAADVVEKKFSDPRATDWERMSTTWSIFGIIGAVRAYAKLIAGIHSAQNAGVDIFGLGGYTSNQTVDSLCACQIGSLTSKACWQDDRQQLLGQVTAGTSRWKKPIIITMGYSQCPFEGKKAFSEVFGRAITGVLTVVTTCIPLIVLRHDVEGDNLDNITLGTALGSALLAGCILPLTLQALNPVGVTHLRALHIVPRRFDDVLKDGDTVITTKMASTIFWQNPEEALSKRSGDRVVVRLLATLAACATIVAYILNYLELGRVPTWKAYVWLGVQFLILTLRFVVWAIRPRILPTRSKSVLFFITGSLVPPLEADADRSHSSLPNNVVHFAVASAGSKLLNQGGTVGNLKLHALDMLAGVAPADIILADYCDIDELMKIGGEMKAIRLPWSWMEEIYVAQGLILGHNPWALGGLYLAAVIQRFGTSAWTFQGLTTIHPRGAGADRAHGEDTYTSYSEKDPALRDVVGVTVGNYGIRGTLVIGDIMNRMPVGHDLMDWHIEFQENVRNCRSTAVPNGPPHQEFHMRNFGDGEHGKKHVSKTVLTIEILLKLGLDIGAKEKEKDHSQCNEFCTIFGF